jgi:hypothetical protein
MKKSEMHEMLVKKTADILCENVAGDNSDYQLWALSNHIAYELLKTAEEQGMQPPSAPFRVHNKRWVPEKEEWYETEDRGMVNQWEPETPE